MKLWDDIKRLAFDQGERKDIILWRGGVASTENEDNFVTNQVTTAEFSDVLNRNGQGALGLSSTWACINLLAGTISTLPLNVYRELNGIKVVDRSHPLQWILHDSPNYDQTAVDFLEYQVAAIELQGNAYAKIERRQDGSIISLTPLRPDIVQVERVGGQLIYSWNENGERVTRNGRDILHIRGPLGDALSGASTLAVCRGSFDQAMFADGASQHIFRNQIQPTGILSTHEDVALNKEQREQFDDYLDQRFRGAKNAGRPLLLDRGMKWTQINLSPEDAQMLETRRFGVEEICRIFGVPPHMIGHTEGSTSWGTGLEQQTLGFVKFSLRRRLKRIEMALEKQLLTQADRARGVSIEFNLEGLLRGDTNTRSQFYDAGLQGKWRTINEVRALENLPPVPWGDRPWGQQQDIQLQEDGTVPPAATPGAGNAA